MNPLKSDNVVARILQAYAYLNTAAGAVLALQLNKELGAMVAWFILRLFWLPAFLSSHWAKSLICCKTSRRTQVKKWKFPTNFLTFKEISYE